MNLSDVIKKCSVAAFEARIPCDLMFGTVVSTNPLKFKIGDIVIPQEMVYVADTLFERREKVSFWGYTDEVTVQQGLRENDTVIFLRKSGGEIYAAVGRV